MVTVNPQIPFPQLFGEILLSYFHIMKRICEINFYVSILVSKWNDRFMKNFLNNLCRVNSVGENVARPVTNEDVLLQYYIKCDCGTYIFWFFQYIKSWIRSLSKKYILYDKKKIRKISILINHRSLIPCHNDLNKNILQIQMWFSVLDISLKALLFF